jgi:dolichol-phosphate mannosyltransferase
MSAVLPAFNEEANIKPAVEALRRALSRYCDGFEIVIVDDGSTDATGAIADDLSLKDPRVVVFHHCPNRGYGAALRTGFCNARKELVFYTDSDNQFDVTQISRLLDHISECDIVVGYRMNRQDAYLRKFFAWGFKVFIRGLFGVSLRDVDCAFKLFRRNVFDSIAILSDRFFVDAEIMARARALRLRVREVGVDHFPRSAGESTVSFSHVFSTLRDAVRVWWCLHRPEKEN